MFKKKLTNALHALLNQIKKGIYVWKITMQYQRDTSVLEVSRKKEIFF